MKLFATLSTSCVLVLSAGAAHAEAVVVKGDGACDFTQRAVEAWEVKDNRQAFCKLLGPTDVVRLASGDSLTGSDGKCEIKSGDKRALTGSLCMKAPALPALVGSYSWFVSGARRGTVYLQANGTCGEAKAGAARRSCTWVVTDVANRKVTIGLDRGEIKDHITLSADGKVLEGENHTGSPLRGERTAEGGAKAPRVYAWTVNGTPFGQMSLYEDGTCSHSNMPGVSCTWTAKEDRLATFVWGNGHQDVVKVSNDPGGDELNLDGTSSVGAVVTGRRIK